MTSCKKLILSLKEKNVHFTFSQEREILSFLNILSFIHKSSPEDILEQEDIKKIVENEKLSPKQKGRKIFNLLREKRYPIFTKYEKKFKSLSPPPYFEGEFEIKDEANSRLCRHKGE